MKKLLLKILVLMRRFPQQPYTKSQKDRTRHDEAVLFSQNINKKKGVRTNARTPPQYKDLKRSKYNK
jgi:hypothetical protein